MLQQIFISILVILTVGVSIFSVGIYFPYIPKIGEYASLATSFFSVYSVLITGVIFIISLITLKIDYSSITIFISLLTCINLIAWSIPVASLYMLADKNNISLSIIKNLELNVNRGEIQTQRSVKYLERDGNTLYLDYYPSFDESNNKKKPLAYVHGGGFTGGNRSDEPEMIEFFREQGYSVFDIGYTLADDENPTWDKAGREVQTALSWISDNADIYNLDMSELVVAGSSAGGTLALQATYGGETEFRGYNNAKYVPASKIITFFPAVDLKTLWERDTEFIGIRSRDTQYIGGTPAEYPERYSKVNTIDLANKASPETLIIHGASDTLIPTDTVRELSSKLSVLGVQNEIIIISYAVHGFTYFSGSFGYQISKGIMKDFLK